MQIFFLSWDPEKAAQEHCDKHVVKQILEAAQLLCSAHWILGNPKNPPPYKKSHIKHPCAIWIRQSIHNYRWLYFFLSFNVR